MSAADAAAPVTDSEAAALRADLADTSSLIVAVSGGPDSTALLVLLAGWRAGLEQRPRLTAVTVDHGLRPESGREAAAVRKLATRFGVPHRTVPWRGDKPHTGLQEAARDARYELLTAEARRTGASHILTGHTLDDQAETVLFRLARGSGIRGLAAMSRATPLATAGAPIVLLRPFLAVPKARLIATLCARGIEFIEDPSNSDPRFTRPRLRRLMRMLAAEGLDAAKLALLAERAGRAEQALERATDDAARRFLRVCASGDARLSVSASDFLRLPAEIALRLLGRMISQAGAEGSAGLAQLEALIMALRSNAEQGWRCRRTLAGAVVTLVQGQLTVQRAPPRRRNAQHIEAGTSRPTRVSGSNRSPVQPKNRPIVLA